MEGNVDMERVKGEWRERVRVRIKETERREERVLPALCLSCHDNQVVNEEHLQQNTTAVSAWIPAPFLLNYPPPPPQSHDSGTLALSFT